MLRLEKIVSNVLVLLLSLLAFMMIFEQYITVPYWLQPVGRMHPMILHFPIAMVVMLVLLDMFKSQLEEESYLKVNKVLMYLTALSTVVSALMGLMLSREESYTSDLMNVHKWVGVSVSYLIFILLFVDHKQWFYKITLYGSMVIIFFAGHYGAGLTHGMDFLLEPIVKSQEIEIRGETPIFQAFIDPLLEAKCKSCHNHQKHKGDLDMTSYELLDHGGENGPVMIAGNAAESEMIVSAMLPMEDERHMPPEGKPQLTDFELDLLKAWIDGGTDPLVSMDLLSQTDTLFMLADQRLQQIRAGKARPKYEFDFAPEKLLASLNNPYRTVMQQTPGSPALEVNIYVKQAYKDEYLSDLKKIKEQIISLNLAYMPVTDEDLAIVGQFSNLEKLNLNNTEVTNNGLTHLDGCDKLESLLLSGTSVDIEMSTALGALESLKEVYLWHTNIDRQDIVGLNEQWPQVEFYSGYTSDQEAPIQLTPPTLGNNSQILETGEAVRLDHKLPGVTIRFTTDGSEPDSVSSALYESPIRLQSFTTIKALAQKEEWLASKVAAYKFFMKGKAPLDIELSTPPNKKFKGNGALTLIDNEKGEADNIDGKSWLGFTETTFTAIVDLGDDPPELQQVLLGYCVNISRYVMPPVAVEVWGGNDQENMRRLKRVIPAQPKQHQPTEVSAIEASFDAAKYRYYKVIGHPVNKLPNWHTAKGKPGWLFVDELFFY